MREGGREGERTEEEREKKREPSISLFLLCTCVEEEGDEEWVESGGLTLIEPTWGTDGRLPCEALTQELLAAGQVAL